MTNSQPKREPATARIHGDHWLEMTATLKPASTAEFADWLQDQLDQMEKDLGQFVTPRSLVKPTNRNQDSISILDGNLS